MDKKLLWWIFGVTKGGVIRAKIVKLLKERPSNAHQLAKKLDLDYKTVRYHIRILLKDGLIVGRGDPITMYFLSDTMEEGYEEFLKICEQIEKE